MHREQTALPETSWFMHYSQLELVSFKLVRSSESQAADSGSVFAVSCRHRAEK